MGHMKQLLLQVFVIIAFLPLSHADLKECRKMSFLSISVIAVALVLLVLLIYFSVFGIKPSNKQDESKMAIFLPNSPYRFGIDALLSPSAVVLGDGRIGVTKRVNLGATKLVVKSLNNEVVVDKTKFQQQMNLLGKIGDHPNIASLRGYCYTMYQKLLIYDFYSEGSLSRHLHGQSLDMGHMKQLLLQVFVIIAFLPLSHADLKECRKMSFLSISVIAVALVLLVLLIYFSVFGIKPSNKQDESKMAIFLPNSPYRFGIDALLSPSAAVLGNGRVGVTKRVNLGATKLVVKSLNDEVVVDKTKFQQQMNLLGNIGDHPNICSLRGYCYTMYQKFLVYDFYSEGSLSRHLHGAKGDGGEFAPLSWESRLKVAVGVGRGLAYLHSKGLSHGNLHSSNIFIRDSTCSVISEMGLVPVLNIPFLPNDGYQSPDPSEHHKLTQSSDIYGFGVILLELITKKRPNESFATATGSRNLAQWARAMRVKDLEDIHCDSYIHRSPLSERKTMFNVAVACIRSLSCCRPEMDGLARELEKLMQTHQAALAAQLQEPCSSLDTIFTHPTVTF